MSSEHLPADDLAELLQRTGHAHHAAYAATDGTDPEWAGWYAAYLQALLGDRLGRILSRSELTYLLVKAEREHDAAGSDAEWPSFYARVILAG